MNSKNLLPTISVALLLGLLVVVVGCREKQDEFENWAPSGGDAGARKYSGLDQINRSNVHELQQAWVYHSGDTRGNVQGNPMIVDGVVYVTTPSAELIALEGTSGKEKWRFNPSKPGEKLGGTIRGVAYWKEGKDERIFFQAGHYLNAVDKGTGIAVLSFGDSGRVNLNAEQVRPPEDMRLTAPAPPVICGNVVVVGCMSWTAPANVSGFDARTGARKWRFNVIPHPDEEGHETWGDSSFWKKGAGVNVWGGLSADVDNGIIYFATGQPKDDFFRPENKGLQLYGNSVVALDVATGKKVWHYQVIHHDIWDLDLPCAPILVDLYKDGKKIAGLVQLSKTGNVFLFNRLTGELLSKVEERPVQPSTLTGEYAYPTQTFVTWPEPFSRQQVTEEDLTTLTPEAHSNALARFKSSRTGWFDPPSLQGNIYYGIHGGAEWGGGSYDPETDRLYVNANELAWQITMRDINQVDNSKDNLDALPGHKVYLASGCISCHGANREGMGSIPKLQNLGKSYSKEQVADIIHNGKGAMPAFSQIPKDELQLLAEYLVGTKSSAQTVKKGDTMNVKKPVYRSLGFTKFLDKEGYPATKPPYGTLNAINLKTGKIDWKVPLGEFKELTERGIPITGTENFGGSIVTKGGLVFIGASKDEKFRAFDKDSGKILWEVTLPFGGYALPSTYMVEGRQYVIIAATGGGKLGTKTGDAYVAFALPLRKQ